MSFSRKQSLFDLNGLKRFKHSWSANKELMGVIDGERAFIGPELVQVDLTNACNNNCIGCWCRSPLLRDTIMSAEVQNQTLPLDLVKRVLHTCAGMGTTNIYLAGGGEPFMHPQVMEIIRHVKHLGMACHINTNCTLVDRNRASELVEMGVDHLIISLWAATPETYSRTHPNKSEATFHQLIDRLRYIIDLRRQGPPHIVLYNVIMNLNYHEIVDMVDLAVELGADAVEFTAVDVIPDHTDKLLLNRQQQLEALEACQWLLHRRKKARSDGKLELRIENFMQRISSSGAVRGDYDIEMVGETPCLIGWNFSRILADGNVNACLKSHRLPVGNIYNNPFDEIWNSPEQKRFRRKAKEGNFNDPFFSKIGNHKNAKVGCYRGCDDLERNRRLWQRLQRQTVSQKLILRMMGYLLRAKQVLSGRNDLGVGLFRPKTDAGWSFHGRCRDVKKTNAKNTQ